MLHKVVMMVVASILMGCSTLGIPTADTFNQRVAVTKTSVTAIRDSATIALKSGTITVADGDNVLKQTDTAWDGIKVVQDMYTKACPTADPKCVATAAENRLMLISSVLKSLQDYLLLQQRK